MSQSLEVNINATSNVPKAMDKAKEATDGFGKQVEGIQKKFTESFKDIFLSFLGPMALLGVAMNYVGKLIEDNEKKREDANQAAIDDTNKLMSAEDKYWANRRNNEKNSKEAIELAATQREQTTLQFLQEDPRGQKMFKELKDKNVWQLKYLTEEGRLSNDPEVQKKVQAMIAEDRMKNPSAGINPNKISDFKGPEGFGNVIGVGPNPVIEAMNAQLEEQQKQTALLEKIANPAGGVQTDFTKKPESK